ncbi:Gx transporter family protein [Maledivibacter halophilus]|uniref:Heptaprenyl diphosphate synthase n=1 Tax=Maledivibacter halophilus TaxID=36842 RepID=A0A1T5IT11_9FIRM|nr:Gx transporter family protein [Maledivibacter halophilus]SKC42266.1 heptaprenyl diphosphate synthase [Maledivibacter halophilus]
MKKTRKLVIMGLFVSMALALHIFEKTIPVPFITPGAKLGLSNIITLTVLISLGFKDAVIVLIIRIILGSIFGGGLSGFIYSISGGMLSVVFMEFIRRIGKENVSVIGISIVGAVSHNIGQLLAAAFVINNINIFVYLPVLFLAAIGTGLFVGLVTKYLLFSLNRIIDI